MDNQSVLLKKITPLNIFFFSLPITISIFFTKILTFVDSIIIARYNLQAISITTTINSFFEIELFLISSIIAVLGIFVSHSLGNKKENLFQLRIIIQGFYFSLIIFIFNPILSHLIKPLLIPNELSELITPYLYTIMFMPFFFCLNMLFNQFLMNANKKKYIIIFNILGNILNAFLTYNLVFGNSYFPELGVFGSALATIISQFFITSLNIVLFFKTTKISLLSFYYQFSFDINIVKKITKIAVPDMMSNLVETCFYFCALTTLVHTANHTSVAFSITYSVYSFLYGYFEGLTESIGIIVSRYICMMDKVRIKKVLISSTILTLGINALIAIFFYFFYSSVIDIFFDLEREQHNNNIKDLIKESLSWACIYLIVDGFLTAYDGLLTSAGDTLFVFKCMFWMFLVLGFLPLFYFYFNPENAHIDLWKIGILRSFGVLVLLHLRYLNKNWTKQLNTFNLQPV